jgi:DNA replication and repair protein RecF
MYLTHLSLTNFRAFNRLDMDVPGRCLMLVGSNAQGKTSILEAVYYLATFTSFFAHTDRRLISFTAGNDPLSVARMVADYQRGDRQHRMEVRLIVETENDNSRLRKEILVDGVKRSMQDAMGQFTAVIFLPQMSRILEGGPEERRRYLNLAISQAVTGYAADISEYGQVLTQRNALLKQLAERGGDRNQLCYWDEMLAQRGAAIMRARIEAIHELEGLAARIHHRLTHSSEVLRLVYQPSYDPVLKPEGQFMLPLQTQVQWTGIGIEQIRKGFIERLTALRNEEIQRGTTTIGPHRDELRLLSNGIDLSDFGSRGQSRTAILALKLAEVYWLRDRTGQWPVLLLDEIMAELDGQRRSDLLDALGECEQVILTTTDAHLFSEVFVRQSAVWQVRGGRVGETTVEGGPG